jgi:hypothetical protein
MTDILRGAQTDHFSQERLTITFKKADFALNDLGIYS